MSGDEEIKKAAEILKKGGVGAFPTETVYGVGANAFDAKAVARVYEVKGRPLGHPLIVHIASIEHLGKVASKVSMKALELTRIFWPGPLTIVVPKSPDLPDIVTGGLGSVGIRIPSHPIARKLLVATGSPIAAPSANAFGSVSATTADHVRESLGNKLDFVLDGGPCSVGIESTIISFLEATPKVLRLGGVPVEDLEKRLGKLELAEKSATPIAPGMLEQHYAPKTKLKLVDKPIPGKKSGLLAFGSEVPSGFTAVENLSTKGDLREAAAALYSALRKLDTAGVDEIQWTKLPPQSLGPAINDRLTRATS